MSTNGFAASEHKRPETEENLTRPFSCLSENGSQCPVKSLSIGIAGGNSHLIQLGKTGILPSGVAPCLPGLTREAGIPQGHEVRAPSSEAPASTATFPSSPKAETDFSYFFF